MEREGQVLWPNQSPNTISQFIRLVNPGPKISKPAALLIALVTEVKECNDQSSKQRQKVQCAAQCGDVNGMQRQGCLVKLTWLSSEFLV